MAAISLALTLLLLAGVVAVVKIGEWLVMDDDRKDQPNTEDNP